MSRMAAPIALEEPPAAGGMRTQRTDRPLFDNTSATTDTTLTGRDKAVVYYDPQPRVVTLYTLTAGKNPAAAPTAFTLYGSLDGKNWTELDSREDQSFQWGPVHPSLRRSGGEAKALYLL